MKPLWTFAEERNSIQWTPPVSDGTNVRKVSECKNELERRRKEEFVPSMELHDGFFFLLVDMTPGPLLNSG